MSHIPTDHGPLRRMRASVLVVVMLCLAAATPVTAQGTHPSLESLAPIEDSVLTAMRGRLHGPAREAADSFLRSPNPGSRAMAILSLGAQVDTNRDALAFLTHVIATDSARFLGSMVASVGLDRDKPDTTSGAVQLVRAILRTSTDSITVSRAITELVRRVHPNVVARYLRDRVQASGGTSAPRWLLRLDQELYDRRWGLVLPRFMREPPPVFAAVPRTAQRIRFFALGDWAEGNNASQQAVSAAVRAAHRRTPFTFGITLGDNFYPNGIESPRSPRWAVEYEQQYGVLGVPVYATLGNHDYYTGDSPAAQIAYTGYSTTWKLPATHYTFTAGPTQFVVIDTESPTPWQLGWLDSVLAASTAKWKIVVGHYDIYSDRVQAEGDLRTLVDLMQRHQVALYLNGHYHSLQHYRVDGIEYVTSGGGGRVALYPIDSTATSGATSGARKFAAKAHGFATFEITDETFTLQFLDTAGKVLYTYTRTRQ